MNRLVAGDCTQPDTSIRLIHHSADVWPRKNALHEFNDINLHDCWLGALGPASAGTGLSQHVDELRNDWSGWPLASRRRRQAPTLCPRASDCGKPHATVEDPTYLPPLKQCSTFSGYFTCYNMGRGEPEFNLREKADYGERTSSTPAAGAHVRRKLFDAAASSSRLVTKLEGV